MTPSERVEAYAYAARIVADCEGDPQLIKLASDHMPADESPWWVLVLALLDAASK